MPSVRRTALALLAALALLLGFITPAAQGPSAQASTTVPVTVTVLGPDGEPFQWTSPDEQLTVRLWGPTFGSSFPVPVTTTGSAQVTVPPGNYQIQVSYGGQRNILSGWGNGQELQAGSTVTTVGAEGGAVTARLRTGGTITGTVTGDGFPLDALSFSVYRASGSLTQDYRAAYDVESQRYTITRVQPGTYRILLYGSAAGQSRLVGAWADGTMAAPESLNSYGGIGGSQLLGSGLVVTAGSMLSMSPLSLEVMSAITGTVTWPGNEPDFLTRYVNAYLDGELVGSKLIRSDGFFSFTDVARRNGTDWVFCVQAAYQWNSHQWAESCWSESGTVVREEADSVIAQPRTVVSGIDIVVAEGTILRYQVLYDLDGNGGVAPAPSTSAEANLYRLNADGTIFTLVEGGLYRYVDGASWHSPGPVMPGTYAVQIVDANRPQLGRTWLLPSGETTPFLSVDNELVIEPGLTIDRDVVLRPIRREFDRLWGPNRYATGVEISKAGFPTDEAPVPVVYIASGVNYPDALSAGPLAAQMGGSMLLVSPTSIPDSVREELGRLEPEKIVIVGGTGAISLSVERDLEQYVEDDPRRVDRVGGANRYEVSRALVAGAFEGQTGMPIFIATGRNYPDALAAGPAAAAVGGAVLLVNGAATTVDTPTRRLLDELDPSVIIVVGGTGVVSPQIENVLRANYPGDERVFRLSGPDRYTGAVNLNRAIFEESSLAFLATGTSFADALTGGALAGRVGAPLYLTRPSCMPGVVSEEITQLRASAVVILGGTGAVSAAVENGAVCGVTSSSAPTSVAAPTAGSADVRVPSGSGDIAALREALGLP